MDGDAAHVPIKWVTAVLREAETMLKNPDVYVLSVLGLQSTGKSTMLNTVFGLQFNVSAGRCTRGAFMQLLPVREKQSSTSYVLVVDTEGLRAPTLKPELAQKRDNELATFVIGLASMTLINIYGEVPGEMDDILQISVLAFLRMREVECKPSCQFVYQNAVKSTKSDIGRAKFVKKLDNLTVQAAQEEECKKEYKCFAEVIKFDDKTDVHHFPGLWSGEPPMAPVNQGYSKAAQMIKLNFIHSLFQASRKSSTRLSSLCKFLNDFWKCLLEENFIFSFRNIQEVIAYKKLESEYSKWEWSFRQNMLKWELWTENKVKTTDVKSVPALVLKKCTSLPQVVEKFHTDYRTKLENFFSSEQSEIMAQWKGRFQDKLRALSDELKRHAETQCSIFEESKIAFSEIEQQQERYAEKVTRGVEEYIATIKQEQDELVKNLENGRLEPHQLRDMLQKRLFTSDNLQKYLKKNIITLVQVSHIEAAIEECDGTLTEDRLQSILTGDLETEQTKKILKTFRPTEEELKASFEKLWTDLIKKIRIVPLDHEKSIDMQTRVERSMFQVLCIKM